MLIAHVLGSTEVEVDGSRADLGGRLPRRLVTALVAAEGRPMSAGALTEAVWGDEPPPSPVASLQAYVSRLRRALGNALQRSGDGYRLAVDDTDAARFAAEVSRALSLLREDRPAEALRAFDSALARWRGEAFADLIETYARTRLDEQRSVAVEERLAARLATGDAPTAAGELEAAVRAEPYRERRWELLILALYRSGRQADALAALRRVRARLADELGIDPGPALQSLERRLLAQDPGLLLPARPAPPPDSPGHPLPDSSGHPLPDSSGHPPPAGPSQPPAGRGSPAGTPPGNPGLPSRSPGWPPGLPPGGQGRIMRPLSHFIGRQEELTALASQDGRLVTLVGPGGAGKTRLAIEFAAGSNPWFARLADVTDPALVPSVVAAALGVRGATVDALSARTTATDPANGRGEAGTAADAHGTTIDAAGARTEAGTAADAHGTTIDAAGARTEAGTAADARGTGARRTVVDAVARALGEQAGLLVLDNCEHVVAAAADLVVELLGRCPGLRVLATSREPLGVDGERLLPVAPLPEADAVALLADRITAVRPGWRPGPDDGVTLAGLAAALDGIPLALELAAARARVLGLGELLDMLRDRFPALGPVPRGALAPHVTLEAAVAWSVDLLSEHDRAVLLRLWPFEGGFPLSAVEDDLDALSALVTRSVVVADTTVTPARYRLLEILRAYCRSRDPNPAASREAHAAWVRAFAERVAPELRGEHSAHAIRLLNRELANLRAGIVHDLAVAPHAALRTAGLLEWFWFRGGLVAEGGRLLRAALDGAPDAPPNDRARAWASLATLIFMTGEEATAIDALGQAIGALGPSPDQEGWAVRGQLHYYESLLLTALGRYDEAAEQGRRAMVVGRRIGQERLVAAGTMTLGWAQAAAGRDEEGRRTLAEAIRRATAIGQRWTTAMSEMLLGRALLLPSLPADPEEALGALGRAVDLFVAEDDVGNVLACLFSGAQALLAAGRREEGVLLAVSVERHAARRGIFPGAADPAGSAVLARELAGADTSGIAPLDEAEMIAMLRPGRAVRGRTANPRAAGKRA
ncbi:BTAD domain-containing putative transcriptional regulator [Actinoplanes sp. NPDC000266]